MNQLVTLTVGEASISLPASIVARKSMEHILESLAVPQVSAIPPLGAYWPGEGGHNLGLFRGEGDAPDYYLIASAKPDTDIVASYGGRDHETEGAGSHSDGLANTKALLADSKEHPAARMASEFTADGHRDFYLPARRELQFAEANAPELFSKVWHWSSTQYSANFAYILVFEGGWLDNNDKNGERVVRPVRRKYF